MTYPKDTAANLFFFMRNTNAFLKTGLTNISCTLTKQNGVVTTVPLANISEVASSPGLYKVAATSADMDYEGQLTLNASQGASFEGQAVYYVSDPLKQIKAALSGTGTLPTVNLKTLSIYNSAGVGLSIGGLLPVAISASSGVNPAVEITAPQSPVLRIVNSANGLTQNFPGCTI